MNQYCTKIIKTSESPGELEAAFLEEHERKINAYINQQCGNNGYVLSNIHSIHDKAGGCLKIITIVVTTDRKG